MRAARIARYGPPDGLAIVELPVPRAGDGEVLVRVHGSSINHVDLLVRQGRVPLSGARGIGLDFAGTVEQASADSSLAAGARVWGYTGYLPGSTGTAAEHVVVKASRLSIAPRSIDLASASALPVAGLTALQALRDVLRLRPGERLLVIGGAGGVGSAAVQLGAAMNAKVTASCSATAETFCRSAGAREVIRYDEDDIGSLAARFDAILDTAGNGLATYRRLTADGGRFATITPQGFARIPLWLATPGPRMRPVVGKPSGADLALLTAEVDAGRLRPLVMRSYPLAAIAEAHRDAERPHGLGKRILLVTPE